MGDKMTLTENQTKFIIFSVVFMMGVAALIMVWNIDISVGAMNSGGCVYQDTKCVPALQFYETALGSLVILIMFLTLSALVIIAF